MLLLAGNVMEPSSIVLIMAPILFPVAMKLGIDPVHFGIMMVVNMEVGMCHPPVGLNLYVASGITKMGITELTIAVWPWLLTMLVFLVIVTYWPWLPCPICSAEAASGCLGHDDASRRPGLRAVHFRGPAFSARRKRRLTPAMGEGRRACPTCYNFEFTRFYLVGALYGGGADAFHHQTRCGRQERHRENLFALSRQPA